MITHLHQVSAYLADTSVTTGGLKNWVKDNVVMVLILVIGLGLLMRSNKGDHSGVFLRVGLLVVSLSVVTIALDATLGLGVGRWAVGLFGIK